MKPLIFIVSLCCILASQTYASTTSVRDVQNWLLQLGYNPGPVDGAYGKKTADALTRFYQGLGKQYDGKLDLNEFRELSNAVSSTNSKAVVECLGPTLCAKLNNRDTINPFLAWKYHFWKLPMNRYNLYWNGGDMPLRDTSALNLQEMRYAFWYTWDDVWGKRVYNDIKKFVVSGEFGHDKEYGETFSIDITHPDYPAALANIAEREVRKKNLDGIMLDWWVDWLPSGFSKKEVREARIRIAKAIRQRLGDDKIILANVMWEKDKHTVEYLNGVFLEFWKDGSEGRLYNSSELSKIESSIEYYNRHLADPKIIAINGHRKTKNITDKDRNSQENRRMAKLLTAMSVVIPTNGYILYGDGSRDDPDTDHDHILYDFYSFDIGQPTEPTMSVKKGVGIREHEDGFVAYNISNRKAKIMRISGQTVEIEAKAGLFCRDSSAELTCLPYD